MVYFYFVEAEAFLGGYSPLDRPFLCFKELTSQSLLAPISLNPLVHHAFTLVRVDIYEFKIVIFFILEPPEFTVLDISEHIVKRDLSYVLVGGLAQYFSFRHVLSRQYAHVFSVQEPLWQLLGLLRINLFRS